MTAKYSCVSLVTKGVGLLNYSYIDVDVETGHLWWKKKERVRLATTNGCYFIHPSTGKDVSDNPNGLREAVRIYEMSTADGSVWI